MRVITRVFKPGEAHGITRLGKVLAFIWNFDRVNRPRIEAMRLSHGPDVPVRGLFGSRDVAAFLSSYGNSGNQERQTDDRGSSEASNLLQLCYHLLFSFRICRAESEIPAGSGRDGI